jgi:hypothetical protein
MAVIALFITFTEANGRAPFGHHGRCAPRVAEAATGLAPSRPARDSPISPSRAIGSAVRWRSGAR